MKNLKYSNQILSFMENIAFEWATPEEIERIKKEFLKSGGQRLSDYAKTVFVAKAGKTIIGFVGFDNALLTNIFISPEFRAPGIASKLITDSLKAQFNSHPKLGRITLDAVADEKKKQLKLQKWYQ